MNVWQKLSLALGVVILWFGLGFGPLLSPLLYTFTPLQRYYLGTYMASSRHAEQRGARTEVRWIWKVRPAPAPPQAEPRTAPKRKGKRAAAAEAEQPLPKLQYELAGERDLDAKPVLDTVWNGGALGFVLSEEAAREGWTGLEQGYPHRVDSGELAADLRRFVYDGDSWRWFFVQPALSLGILVCFILACRAWLERERERTRWGRPLGMHELLWQRLLLPQLERLLALPGRMRYRVIEAAVTPALPPPAPAAASAPAPVPSTPATAAAEPKAAYVWDESQGIE